MTGTGDFSAKSSSVDWLLSLAIMPLTMPPRTCATSTAGSRVLSPISVGCRLIAWPPSWVIATSKLTRVRRLGLLEDHRQRLARQDRLVPSVLPQFVPQPHRRLQHVPEKGLVVMGEFEKVEGHGLGKLEGGGFCSASDSVRPHNVISVPMPSAV